jgi:glycosyltransferase involved in cell wall biosynthesis
VKICFICSEYPPGPHGGIGTMTQVLSRVLAGAGHDVQSLGVYPKQYPASDYEEDHGVRVRRLRDSGRTLDWAWQRRRLFAEVARLVKRGEVDIVEAPDYQGWTALWPRLAKPVLIRLHGSESYFAAELGKPVSKVSFHLERAALRRADYWCSVSQYTADRTQKLFRLASGPSAVLYNPVEIPELPRGTVRDRHTVVFSGTLTAKKGIISLIDAWPRVLAQCPDAKLHVYGKDGRTNDGGSMREHLQKRLGSAAASVVFQGHVSRAKLFEAFFSARAAVFPSHAEAFAIAPLESMACECPTIYSTRGSGPELLTHGKQGLLVDPDRPEEIAGAIVRLIQDDGQWSSIARAGRRHVIENFSTRTLLAANIDFYGHMLDSFRSGQRERARVAL